MKSFIYFILFLITILMMRVFVIDIVSISSHSMIPSLWPGDWVVINKLATVRKGNIITFYDAETSQIFIKRIIGVAGDKVSYQDDEVIVNDIHHEREKGQLLRELPLELKKRDFKSFIEIVNSIRYMILIDQDKVTRNTKSIMIENNFYYVLGDNRNHSKDSRDFGLVSKDKVIGRAVFVLYSNGHFVINI